MIATIRHGSMLCVAAQQQQELEALRSDSKLVEQPKCVSWGFMSLSQNQLQLCVANKAFENAAKLPKYISLAFLFHFESGTHDPVCTLSIISLFTASQTRKEVTEHLGTDLASLVAKTSEWHEGPLMDLRMVPASQTLKAEPGMLTEITPEMLSESPLTYWNQATSSCEMARSYQTSISHWVVGGCDSMLMELLKKFQTVPVGPSRSRMYALSREGVRSPSCRTCAQCQ